MNNNLNNNLYYYYLIYLGISTLNRFIKLKGLISLIS